MTRVIGSTALLSLALALVACAGGPAPRSRADAGATTACRARADEAYNRSNRAAIYRADTYDSNLRDSPYASSGTRDYMVRSLPDEYARDKMIDSCLQGIGAAPDTAIDVTPPGAVPAKR